MLAIVAILVLGEAFSTGCLVEFLAKLPEVFPDTIIRHQGSKVF